MVHYPADNTSISTAALRYTDELKSLTLLPWCTSRWGVQWLTAPKSTTSQNLYSIPASLGMLNLTRCLCTTQTFLCGPRRIFSHVYNELSTVVNVEQVHFHCSSEGISTTFILSCTTWMCFQMNCSVTPQVPLTRGLNIHKKPSGWSFVIQNCLTPVSWKLFRALQRWAFYTSWTAQVSCIQNSQYRWLGFDCENLQIVNIGHSMQYVIAWLSHLIRVSPYKWQSYLSILGHEMALAWHL